MRTIRILFDGFQNTQKTGYRKEAEVILSLLQKHYKVELSENPEYIFYNVDGSQYYKYDGIRIFCTIEAICPDFNLCDYGIGFEHMAFGDRYFRFPNFCFYPEVVSKMIEKHLRVEDAMADRGFCSFIYSNGRADGMRAELFERLSAYKKIDSGGKFKNNLPDQKPVTDKYAFESQHKFSIACENASYPGYHTEKLAEAFAAGTIPIYWGDPLSEKVFNKNAYVDVSAYCSLDTVVARVKELDENRDAYLRMLREPAISRGENVFRYDGVESGAEVAQRKLKELEDYLLYIINQPLETAYRRNRGFWGRQYLEEKRAVGRLLEKYEKVRNFRPIAILRQLLYKR